MISINMIYTIHSLHPIQVSQVGRKKRRTEWKWNGRGMRNYYLSNLVIIKIIIDDDYIIARAMRSDNGNFNGIWKDETAPTTTKAREEKNRLGNLKQQNGREATPCCTSKKVHIYKTAMFAYLEQCLIHFCIDWYLDFVEFLIELRTMVVDIINGDNNTCS